MAVYKRGKGDQGIAHFPKKFITLYAPGTTAAIAVGDVVMIDVTDSTNGLGGSVEVCTDTANGEQLALGIATQAVPLTSPVTPKNIVVQIAGKYENANCGTSVVAGDSLVCSQASSNNAAGRLVTYVAGDLAPIFAVALEDEPGDSTANLADIMILNKGFF